MDYDSRWRLELERLRRQCILEPPPLMTRRYNSTDIERYVSIIRPFHKKWGRWWLWILLSPVLSGIMAFKRLEQSFRMFVRWKHIHAHYQTKRLSTGSAALCLGIHLCLRCGLNGMLFFSDLLNILLRKAIWREESRYTLSDKRDEKIVQQLINWVKRINTTWWWFQSLWPAIDQGPPHQQAMRAGFFIFCLGIVIYYPIMLNTVFPSENGVLMSLTYATIMFIWPMPVGIWMMFLF